MGTIIANYRQRKWAAVAATALTQHQEPECNPTVAAACNEPPAMSPQEHVHPHECNEAESMQQLREPRDDSSSSPLPEQLQASSESVAVSCKNHSAPKDEADDRAVSPMAAELMAPIGADVRQPLEPARGDCHAAGHVGNMTTHVLSMLSSAEQPVSADALPTAIQSLSSFTWIQQSSPTSVDALRPVIQIPSSPALMQQPNPSPRYGNLSKSNASSSQEPSPRYGNLSKSNASSSQEPSPRYGNLSNRSMPPSPCSSCSSSTRYGNLSNRSPPSSPAPIQPPSPRYGNLSNRSMPPSPCSSSSSCSSSGAVPAPPPTPRQGHQSAHRESSSGLPPLQEAEPRGLASDSEDDEMLALSSRSKGSSQSSGQRAGFSSGSPKSHTRWEVSSSLNASLRASCRGSRVTSQCPSPGTSPSASAASVVQPAHTADPPKGRSPKRASPSLSSPGVDVPVMESRPATRFKRSGASAAGWAIEVRGSRATLARPRAVPPAALSAVPLQQPTESCAARSAPFSAE